MDTLEKKLDLTMIFSLPKCNLMCKYCRSAEYKVEGVLTNDEIIELIKACFDAGIKKIRWTGGEPTVRRNFVGLVNKAKEIGIEKQFLSTNGTVLYKMASALREGGIERVNISLDTFDRNKFYEITGKDLLDDVLKSINVATEEFKLVKINSVLATDNVNDVYKFIDFVAGFGNPPIPRFIPLVKVGCAKEFYSDKKLLTANEILKAFSDHYGKISQVDIVENHNPFAQHYKIENNGLIFGILLYYDSDVIIDSSRFKMLRINPNGYASSDLHSTNIHHVRDLNYDEKVDLIRELIKEKQSHNDAWHANSIRVVSPNLDFWRFGGALEEAYTIRNTMSDKH
jgi:cyclic pyranopterin phosphate synthase